MKVTQSQKYFIAYKGLKKNHELQIKVKSKIIAKKKKKSKREAHQQLLERNKFKLGIK